jgi:hypothetical protein
MTVREYLENLRRDTTVLYETATMNISAVNSMTASDMGYFADQSTAINGYLRYDMCLKLLPYEVLETPMLFEHTEKNQRENDTGKD